MSVTIPPVETVLLSQLKTDGSNPNFMSKQQHDRLAESMKKWGFIVPIVTNRDYLVADGEQRLAVAKELGMTEALVIRLDVADVDRRLIRQVLNKLKGEHDFKLDAEEFRRIITAGEQADLQYMLALSDDKLKLYVNPQESQIALNSTYEIIVECKDETQQKDVYAKLSGEGYKCRVLTL